MPYWTEYAWGPFTTGLITLPYYARAYWKASKLCRESIREDRSAENAFLAVSMVNNVRLAIELGMKHDFILNQFLHKETVSDWSYGHDLEVLARKLACQKEPVYSQLLEYGDLEFPLTPEVLETIAALNEIDPGSVFTRYPHITRNGDSPQIEAPTLRIDWFKHDQDGLHQIEIEEFELKTDLAFVALERYGRDLATGYAYLNGIETNIYSDIAKTLGLLEPRLLLSRISGMKLP